MPGKTWNPVRGCSRVSEGCRNCYAERIAARFSGSPSDPAAPFHGFADRRTKRWTGNVELLPEKLAEPLSWRKPCRVFVNSMSDLFHEKLADAAIDQVFAVIAQAPRHTFQILTKRAERMRDYCSGLAAMDRRARGVRFVRAMYEDHPARGLVLGALDRGEQQTGGLDWPLPNAWLGVSVEDQETADERIPLLLQTPAAVRFVSYEPALGPADFTKVGRRTESTAVINALTGYYDHAPYEEGIGGALDWLIVGGESGPNARAFDLAWARSVIAQCRAAGVPCFVKQLGAHPLEEEACGPPEAEALAKKMGLGPVVARVTEYALRDRKGGDMQEWPADLRVRQFPEARP
jgi:protein gp37